MAVWNWINANASQLGLIILIVMVLVAHFFWKQLVDKTIPSYMEEKGKNLATKQDVEKITRKTEQVQKEFKEDFERFTTDIHFKNDFYSQQYEELYAELYTIIIQSEYMRYLMKQKSGQTFSFEDYQFIAVSPIHKSKTKVETKDDAPLTVSHTEEQIETPESKFTCLKLSELIIDRGKFASPELLKLAVSYRFVHGLIMDSDVTKNEDFRLQGEIVRRIVREYNELRCNLKMDYSDEEIENGQILGIEVAQK